jgi:hypothetical protein
MMVKEGRVGVFGSMPLFEAYRAKPWNYLRGWSGSFDPGWRFVVAA